MPSFSHPADSISAPDERRSPEATPAARSLTLSRAEIAILLVALVVLGVLRWLTITSHHWNSDETQHLHVVWAWTVGKLQYRDVFDNHTPLFHILNAPLLRWFGERADIVLVMRRVMIPLFAIGVWSVYQLGALLYDRRKGWFAAALAAFLPAFFYRMGEFRTDVMWTTIWLVALVVALSGKLTPWRTFSAALLLGAAFAVSMKSTVLVLCVAIAGLITWLLAGKPISKVWPRHAAAFVIGLLIVPGAIVGYFASQGALQPLYHCVIEHNTMPGQNLAHMITKQVRSTAMLWLIPAGACVWAMLPAVRRETGRGYRRLFLFLIAGTYYSLLRAFWPVITTQDFLPWLPLLPIFAVAGLAWAREWAQGRFKLRLPWMLAPALVLAGELIWIVQASIKDREPLLENVEARRIAHQGAVLRLVEPGEYVLDLKGETIYRPRPTYLVFETLTRNQILSGRLQDDTIPRLIETRTTAVRPSKRMMEEAKTFLDRNYVRVEGCRVLGVRIPVVRNTPLAFAIVIPERYGIIGREGAISGTLDGQPFEGPRWLAAGRHELTVTSPTSDVAVFWARALERGFSPYHPSTDASDSD